MNYRKNLWKYDKKVSEVMRELAKHVDVAIANEEDVQKSLEITLTTISKTLFGQFSENCFAGRKKNGLHCKPFIKKLRTSFLFQMILTKECRPCPAFGAVRSSQLVQ